MFDIVVVNNGLAGGGTERQSTTFANFVSEEGYSVKIIASHRSKHFYKLDQRVEFIEPSFERKGYTLFFYTIKVLRFLRKEISKSEATTVFSYNESLNPFVILVCLGLGINVFVRESMHPKAKLPLPTELLRKWLYPLAKGVLVQTNYGQKILSHNIPKATVHAIPNPVKMFNLNIADTRNRRIVSVGRLEEVKGHKYLIEAFARIDNKGWELHIIGDGSMRDELENLADSLKLGDFVTFHGHLIDFEEILSTAEIFVLPSIKEGFPNALIEAMSVPLACVSGDYYEGSPEIIEDGINGLLFEPRNVEALSNTLQMLVENDKLRESLKAKAELVKKKYNLDKIGLEYLKIFRIYESKKNSK